MERNERTLEWDMLRTYNETENMYMYKFAVSLFLLEKAETPWEMVLARKAHYAACNSMFDAKLVKEMGNIHNAYIDLCYQERLASAKKAS